MCTDLDQIYPSWRILKCEQITYLLVDLVGSILIDYVSM